MRSMKKFKRRLLLALSNSSLMQIHILLKGMKGRFMS